MGINKIREDWQRFRRIIAGKARKELSKWFTKGRMFRLRPDGKGRIAIPLPKIENPHILYGPHDEGVGRGPGKKDDVIDKDKEKGKGNNGATQDEGENMLIGIEMEELLKFMKEDLQLPNMHTKLNQTYEEEIIRYNNISRVGPRSLLHKRRTILEALKRQAAMGEGNEEVLLPGYQTPIPQINFANDDLRYRQWNVYKKPSSNAVIFLMRDGSGSMDELKCEIVSDMSWWIEIWIRQFYKKVEVIHIWHDTEAKLTNSIDFYKMRYGGGTTCSTALKLMTKQIKNRFPPHIWNIYGLYFGDGDNWQSDNKVFTDVMKKNLHPGVVNLMAVTQILSWRYEQSLKAHVDSKIKDGSLNKNFVRTAAIGGKKSDDDKDDGNYYYRRERTPEMDEDIKNAIMDILGAKRENVEAGAAI